MGQVSIYAACESRPVDPTTGKLRFHECSAVSRRCIHCGRKIEPMTCNGCGRFLKLSEIEAFECRCVKCA